MFLQDAFRLTVFGWFVFPLKAGTKIPAIAKEDGGRGCLDATDDEIILEQWDRRYPRANIGVACGKISNILVIDLDPRNGSDASVARLAAKKQTFPPTVTAKTASGGTHLYYAYEPELKNSKSALAPGIDVKTTGGYVVAPPSVLKDGGKYLWKTSPLGDRLPRLPIWAVQALKPKPAPIVPYNKATVPQDISKLVDFAAKAPEGQRNNSLFWAACRAAEQGQLDGSAEASFLNAAISTGLDREAAVKTIHSARKKGRIA